MSIISIQNAIIGGNFSSNPWQRGEIFVSAADGQYTADMFRYNKIGTMVSDIAKDPDAPTPIEAGAYSSDSLLLSVTNAQPVLGAGDYQEIVYTVEGYDAQFFVQNDFALHFWTKSNTPGTYCVYFTNSGNDRSFVSEFTIGSSNVWEYKVIHVSGAPATGSWDFTNGAGLKIGFSTGAGTTFHTANPDTWQNANNKCTANQTNLSALVANEFRIDLVSLKAGCHIGSYTYESEADILAKCQRYYEKSYDAATAIATATTTGATIFKYASTASSPKSATSFFTQRKRAAPTVTTYDEAGNSGRITLRLSSGTTDNIVPGLVASSESNVNVTTPNSPTHAGLSYQWVADASF